jgi:hypothetical protein
MWREGEGKPMERPAPDFKADPTPICNTCPQIGQASKWAGVMRPGGNPIRQVCCGTIEA